MKNPSTLLLVITSLLVAFAQAKEKPNIIFILTDDQGYGDLGRHGHPFLKTPHTDRLYDEGVRFDNFYVSPSCSPTRAALLTGMHEFKNGVTHTRDPREQLWTGATIIPQLLKTAGYRTGHIGKWHLGWHPEYHPFDRGFDYTLQGAQHFDPKLLVKKTGEKPKHIKGKGFREDLYFDHAMSFIKESGEQPFFLYLCTYSPHTPLLCPEEYIAPFKGKMSDKEATYLGMIANVDFNVGRLLKFLEDEELDKDTIVAFVNDNGVTVGLEVYNANMRGSKCSIWEGGSRAMSLWRWPGKWKPKTVNNLTAHLDILPTLCELAGAEIPAELKPQLDGYSLVPLLEAKKDISWNDDRFLFHHVARWPSGMAKDHKYAMAGIRQGNFLLCKSRACDNPGCSPKVLGNQCATLRSVEKGVVKAHYTKGNAKYHWGSTPKDKWVLIDTKKDPGCFVDISEKHPEMIKEMVSAYDKWWDGMFDNMVARGGEEILNSQKAKKK